MPLWAAYLVKVYAWRTILQGNGFLEAILEPFGIEGPGYAELNFSVRYTVELGGNRSLGLFWDLFNATNRTNLNGVQSNRSSSAFLTSTTAFLPRQMQVGARFSF